MFDILDDTSIMTSGQAAVLNGSETGDVSTHTIDINSLFAPELYETGSFDLRSIEDTSFGKILDAVPLPALVVDESHYIVFANQSCSKMVVRQERLRGRPFADLVASPRNPRRARALIDKAEAILDKAFETRKPRVVEAILEFDDQKLWSRLHLRTVRIGSARYVLVMIEDVTSQKMREKLIEREQSRILEQNRELEEQVRSLTKQLDQARESLRQSVGRLAQLRQR